MRPSAERTPETVTMSRVALGRPVQPCAGVGAAAKVALAAATSLSYLNGRICPPTGQPVAWCVARTLSISATCRAIFSTAASPPRVS